MNKIELFDAHPASLASQTTDADAHRDLYLAVTRLITDFQIASTKPAFDCAAMITAQLLRYSPRERSQILSALRAVLDIVGVAK